MEDLEQENKQLQSANDRQKEMLDDYLKEIKQLKKQCDEYKECKQKWFDKLEQIKKRWNEISVDTDAVEDCVKMCIFIEKEILGRKDEETQANFYLD